MRSAFILLVVLLQVPSPVRAAQVRVGDVAPAVSLTDWQGQPRQLAEWRGSVVVLDFWASWCPVCRQALPALDALARRYAGSLRVLAVNVDHGGAGAEHFLAEALPTPAMTLLRDSEGTTMARFGAQGMPALYLIDREGTVRLVETGYEADAMTAIEARVVEQLKARSLDHDAAGQREQ